MKTFIIILISLGFAFSTQAQVFNTIPSSQEVRSLGDGWYKFNLEGVTFDVEIRTGRYAQGNIKWFDGSKYSGELAGTYLGGSGTYTWPDGSKYEGAFKKNQRHGKGSLINTDGTKWSGKWKENQKNGKGKVFDADGNLLKEGVWKLGELVAQK